MNSTAAMQRLRDENEELRERIALLQEALTPELYAPPEWRLTRSERVILSTLVARPMVTKNMLMAALYASRGRDYPEEKIVEVYICRIRNKLKPHQIAIHTHWGDGWSMDPQMRQQLQRQLMPPATVT